MIYSGQTLTKIFYTYNGFGQPVDADSLPTGTLVVNGADNGATVTVTNLSTGRYKAAVTLPPLAVGDVVDLSITATVGGVARSAVVYTDVAGVAAPSVAAIAAGIDKTGYSLTSDYDLAKSAAQAGDPMALTPETLAALPSTDLTPVTAVTSKLDAMIQLTEGNYSYKASALNLDLAPITAVTNKIDTMLLDIDGTYSFKTSAINFTSITTVTNKLNSMLQHADGVYTYKTSAIDFTPAITLITAHFDSVITPAGVGADQVTLTFMSEGTAIADADVWITADSLGLQVVAGTLQTNSDGKVTFLLDAGSTYYLWMQKNGVNPVLGQQFVAVADS